MMVESSHKYFSKDAGWKIMPNCVAFTVGYQLPAEGDNLPTLKSQLQVGGRIVALRFLLFLLLGQHGMPPFVLTP